MSRFWVIWGGLVMWLVGGIVGGLISVSVTAFYAWHDLDKRVALLQQSVFRIEQRLGTAAPGDSLTAAATTGEDAP